MAGQTTTNYKFIGTFTRYSSWTARPEAVLEYFQIPHTEAMVPLADVKQVSHTGLVPLLEWTTPNNTTLTINDSLAICEFLAEQHPDLHLWPQDAQLRALARSAAAEMHSGFSTIRNTFQTNFIARYTGDIPIPDAARPEIARLLNLWESARKFTSTRLAELGVKDEGFLFGGFSIADAFFWPVLWRFRTYSLPLEGASVEARAWMAKMWSDPTFKKLGRKYFEQSKDPKTKVEKYDNIFADRPDVKYGTFEEDWVLE